MLHITESVDIPASAQRLWNEIGGFDRVGDWHPWLERLETRAGERGSIRIADGKDGSRQIERLTNLDPQRHSYEYTIQRSSMPVCQYRGQFRVEPAGPAGSRVIWSARFELTDAGDGRTIEAVRHFLHAGMESLRARYGAA